MSVSELDVAALNAILAEVTAPFVKALDLQVTSATAQQVTLRMPITPSVVHAGGVVCGQALMAAADTAMIVAVAASLGEFRPMTTVQLQTSFLKPVPKDCSEVQVICTLLRRGRSLAFGDIALKVADRKAQGMQQGTQQGTLAAHATTTYALL